MKIKAEWDLLSSRIPCYRVHYQKTKKGKWVEVISEEFNSKGMSTGNRKNDLEGAPLTDIQKAVVYELVDQICSPQVEGASYRSIVVDVR